MLPFLPLETAGTVGQSQRAPGSPCQRAAPHRRADHVDATLTWHAVSRCAVFERQGMSIDTETSIGSVVITLTLGRSAFVTPPPQYVAQNEGTKTSRRFK